MSGPSVDIVVCIHNALDDVTNCLDALDRTRFTGPQPGVILVDDGSDRPTASALRDWAGPRDHVRLERRDSPGGYTVAANTGVAASRADLVVLLNSDTIVPARWLDKIARVFDHSPDIGIVGPLSNAASWQSVPELAAPTGGWAINDLPEGATVDDMDALVELAARSVPVIPRVPFVNGFCYAIRRAVIDRIGTFDETGFPRGFGEEDDFTLRAVDAGFGVALALDTYVFHAKSKSYGSATRSTLTAAGQEKLRLKHGAGRLERGSLTMRRNPYLERMRREVGLLIEARTGTTTPAMA